MNSPEQTAKSFDLGAGWRFNTYEDGTATFYNGEKHQVITLSAASFETLKRLIRAQGA